MGFGISVNLRGMNRRRFFGSLAAIAAAAALDPERALWIPNKKLISIPAPRIMTDRVEVYDNRTYKLVERWWKERGGVYRQISGQEPEITPFAEVPFVKMPPFELPLRLHRQ
jgi:hypothetical protein